MLNMKKKQIKLQLYVFFVFSVSKCNNNKFKRNKSRESQTIHNNAGASV